MSINILITLKSNNLFISFYFEKTCKTFPTHCFTLNSPQNAMQQLSANQRCFRALQCFPTNQIAVSALAVAKRERSLSQTHRGPQTCWMLLRKLLKIKIKQSGTNLKTCLGELPIYFYLCKQWVGKLLSRFSTFLL